MSYINICNLFASAIHHITFSPVCRLREFCLWRWNTTFLETETKKVGKSTWYNTHNIRSLIRTPQVCPRHRCKRKKPLWNTHKHKHTYTHAHTHAHKHTHTHTHTHTANACNSRAPCFKFGSVLKQYQFNSTYGTWQLRKDIMIGNYKHLTTRKNLKWLSAT